MKKSESKYDILPLTPSKKRSKMALKKTLESHEVSFGGLRIKESTINMPHLLLIAGNGRNVGKTTFACRIISYLAATNEVIGLKISPHFHTFNPSDLVFKNDNVVIIDENQINSKDSSLMLQAGAKKVYYVTVKQDFLKEAIEHLIKILPNRLIVCESGGLIEFISPGLFLMVKRTGEEIVKTHLLPYSPIVVNNDGTNFDFDFHQLEYKNHQINLKK